jgi:hypothetical protein
MSTLPIIKIEQELMTAKLLLSTRVEASRLDDAERRFQYQKEENDKRIAQIRKLQRVIDDYEKVFDMHQDEFQRIKAICFGQPLEFIEIAGICDRALINIRSKVSLIAQVQEAKKENDDLRNVLLSILNTIPVYNEGDFVHLHYDADGNELGLERIDPTSIIQNIQELIHNKFS